MTGEINDHGKWYCSHQGRRIKGAVRKTGHRLHNATIEVLNEVGVKVLHEEALELMKFCGCNVDFDQQVVSIPEGVLMIYVDMASTEVKVCGRNPKYYLTLDDSDHVYVMAGAGALHYIDLEGNRREPTMKALEDFTRLEDTLEYMCGIFDTWRRTGSAGRADQAVTADYPTRH